jgi:transglutaminase-like putative cysteine protease
VTADELRARTWCGVACAIAQVAATASGMVPWWALPISLALTVAVGRLHGPVNQTRARLTRGLGVTSVAIFTAIIAVRTTTQARAGVIDPTGTLRLLSEALVVLSLVMAPAARTAREHRAWLTVTMGVLVAAAAGGRTGQAGFFAVVSWIVLLVATAKVQTTAAYSGGAMPAVVLGKEIRQRTGWLTPLDAAGPVIATLLAGALVFVALPSGLGGGGLARRIARAVQQVNLVSVDRAQVGVDTRGFGDLSLLARGQLPDSPILRVPLESPQLWRATVYQTYTGTAWEAHFAATLTPILGSSVNVPVLSDDPLPNRGSAHTYSVQVEPSADADLVWAPGVPVRVSAPANEVRGVLRFPDNVRVILQRGAGSSPFTQYSVTSVTPVTNPARLEAAAGPDPTTAAWTQLPQELPAEVGRLAHQVTATATNRYQAVVDLERYLRDHETYTLNAPLPGRGQDAVDDFLFHTHLGFCELFASAEAVLLRTLGIPARVVSGLAYGVPDGATRLYVAANAHAWVEVYYPGVGWSPTDPTAGVHLAAGPPSHPSLVSRIFNRLASAIPGGRLALAVLSAAVLVALGWTVRWLVTGRGFRRRRRVAGREPGPVLAAFLRATRHRHGPPPRAPAETARQYIYRLGPPEPGLSHALVTLEQELYGAAPPDEVSVDAAVHAFEGLVSEPR